ICFFSASVGSGFTGSGAGIASASGGLSGAAVACTIDLASSLLIPLFGTSAGIVSTGEDLFSELSRYLVLVRIKCPVILRPQMEPRNAVTLGVSEILRAPVFPE